jgi:uncharacterized protein
VAESAVRQFVLKVHSRCNLACDYCYVYESVDQSWRRQPKQIAAATVRATGERIAEHAKRHSLERVTVTLHGGEPLLVGHEGLREIVDGLRQAVGNGGIQGRLPKIPETKRLSRGMELAGSETSLPTCPTACGG